MQTLSERSGRTIRRKHTNGRTNKFASTTTDHVGAENFLPLQTIESIQPALSNYQRFVSKIDSFCLNVKDAFSEHISCKKGCYECCSDISVFFVEAVNIDLGLQTLPDDIIEFLYDKAAINAKSSMQNNICPLLDNETCCLYSYRPLICRTHGLPVLVDDKIEHCPMNFVKMPFLPKHAIMDLALINETLWAINKLFMAQWPIKNIPVRLNISEVLSWRAPQFCHHRIS